MSLKSGLRIIAILLILGGLGLFRFALNVYKGEVYIPTENYHITDIVENSPAAAIDLRVNDELLALNDEPISNNFYEGGNRDSLAETELLIQRDGQPQTVTFVEGDYSNELGGKLGIIILKMKKASPLSVEAIRSHFQHLFYVNPSPVFLERRMIIRNLQILQLTLGVILFTYSILPTKKGSKFTLDP